MGAEIDVWATNSKLQTCAVKVEMSFIDLLSDWTSQECLNAELLPNQSTELLSTPCPCPPPRPYHNPAITTSYSVVVGVRLLDLNTGEVLARYADWPQPYRHVDFPRPRLEVRVDGERISIDTDKPVKGLWLSVDDNDGDGVKWSDNALDMMPGDTQVIIAEGLRGRAVKVAFMGQENAISV